MKALVAYDSHSGYTKAIAEAIGDALGPRIDVKVTLAAEVVPDDLSGIDLLVVGGPTEAHRETPALRAMLSGPGQGALAGLAAAAFDTRLHWPKLLSGSTADDAAKQLKAAGCRLLVSPESFFVEGKVGTPDAAELEHAKAWATQLMSALLSPVG